MIIPQHLLAGYGGELRDVYFSERSLEHDRLSGLRFLPGDRRGDRLFITRLFGFRVERLGLRARVFLTVRFFRRAPLCDRFLAI